MTDISPKIANYSIVVVGQMNTAIHHPSWYHMVGLIDESEMEEATTNGSTITFPQMSNFRTSLFSIGCQINRWEIVTQNHEQIERIRSIAQALFDKLLPHTPVNSFGVNVESFFDANVAGLDVALGSAASVSPFNFGFTNPRFHEMRVSTQKPSYNMSVLIRFLDMTATLGLTITAQYALPKDQKDRFYLKDFFDPDFDNFIIEATRISSESAQNIISLR